MTKRKRKKLLDASAMADLIETSHQAQQFENSGTVPWVEADG
jgi:hypothetical protein